MAKDKRGLFLALIRGIGILAAISLAFGLLAALLAPGAQPSGWDPQTVATRILAKQPGGCPQATASPSKPPTQSRRAPRTALPEQRYDAPVRAQVVRADGTPCRSLIGGPFDPNGAAVYTTPIPDSSDRLQVELDDPTPGWSSSRTKAFIITSLGSLITAMVALGLATAPRRSTGAQLSRQLQRLRPGKTSADQPFPPGDRGRPANQPWPPAQPMPPSGPASATAAPPPPPQPTSPKSVRPVALAGLTTSGISGLTVDRGTSGQFDVYAATQVGLQHARTGRTREDAYAVGGAPDAGWVFLAVADGLGSAHDSHAAAQLAVRTALRQLQDRLPRADPRFTAGEWGRIAAETVTAVAAALDPAVVDSFARELGFLPGQADDEMKRSAPACTLAFAALGPVYDDGYTLLWGCVGDCDLLVVDLDSDHIGWLTDTPTKQGGGLVSNVTRALPRDVDHLCTDVIKVPPSLMTVLASDGMADAIRDESRQFAQLLPQIAGTNPAEWKFGEIVGFDLPGLHDDRTIVAAWPRRAHGHAARRERTTRA